MILTSTTVFVLIFASSLTDPRKTRASALAYAFSFPSCAPYESKTVVGVKIVICCESKKLAYAFHYMIHLLFFVLLALVVFCFVFVLLLSRAFFFAKELEEY